MPQKRDPLLNPMQFEQNRTRIEDLDKEERALVNIHAQEYDHLRMIDSFGHDLATKKDELYQFKMGQYKELSGIRNE